MDGATIQTLTAASWMLVGVALLVLNSPIPKPFLRVGAAVSILWAVVLASFANGWQLPDFLLLLASAGPPLWILMVIGWTHVD
jgi:hypothetical protein